MKDNFLYNRYKFLYGKLRLLHTKIKRKCKRKTTDLKFEISVVGVVGCHSAGRGFRPSQTTRVSVEKNIGSKAT